MQEVYFESEKEVISFCEHLFTRNVQMDLRWKTDKEWGNRIAFGDQMQKSELMDTIAKAMVHVFISHRLGSWIKAVLKDYYYYKNEEEIERIHDIVCWIFLGADEDSSQIRNKKGDPSQLLHSLFIANLKSSASVHFDSLVKFRLKVFKDCLVHYVGLAIDEFKQEENHQEFIHMLRDYIMKKKPGFPIVHILQGRTFDFFRENGKRLTKIDLKQAMRKEPLYILGLDEDEWNLSPLIALAPEKLIIYGDDPSEPKTLTVINVFQEKVEFRPFSQFPFRKQIQNEFN